MAVLVEGISVVIRCKAIVASYIGGQSAFRRDLPNDTLCADGELAAVMFMTPADVEAYACVLEQRGLKYFDGEKALDFVVVDQHTGLRAPCDWVLFGRTNWNNFDGCTISVCELIPASASRVVVPANWTYENSLTANGVYFWQGKKQ